MHSYNYIEVWTCNPIPEDQVLIQRTNVDGHEGDDLEQIEEQIGASAPPDCYTLFAMYNEEMPVFDHD